MLDLIFRSNWQIRDGNAARYRWSPALVMQMMAHANLDGSWWPHLARSCRRWLLATHGMPWASRSCSRSCSCEVVLIRGPCTSSSRQSGYETINFVNGLLLGSRTAMHVRHPTDNQPTSTSPCLSSPRRIPLRYGTTGLTTYSAGWSTSSVWRRTVERQSFAPGNLGIYPGFYIAAVTSGCLLEIGQRF
jgi:hypothetical protein